MQKRKKKRIEIFKVRLRSLSLALSCSGFMTPVYGMLSEDWSGHDWSKLFYKPHIEGQPIVGQQILSYLDDRSLGRSAQVDQQWRDAVRKRRTLANPCLYHLPSPLIPHQWALMQDIIQNTSAIPDVYSPLIKEIRKMAASLNQRHIDKNRREETKSIIFNAMSDAFKNLIEPSLSLYPWFLMREQDALKGNILHRDHCSFDRLRNVINLLNDLKNRDFILNHPISSLLGQLQSTYEHYIEQICSLSPEQREILLFPVILQGDFLQEPYLISKSIAYKLISMGPHGVPEKKDDGSSSIVSHVGNIYTKQNLNKTARYENQDIELSIINKVMQSLDNSSDSIRDVVEKYKHSIDLFADEKLSPHLFLKKNIILDDSLALDHPSLEKLNSAILGLQNLQKEPLLQGTPLKASLQGLEDHYQAYRQELCNASWYQRRVIAGFEVTLDPGMEWAMSSFHRLLFGEGIAPSSLLILSSVPVDKPLSSKISEITRDLKKRLERRDEGNKEDIKNRLHEDINLKKSKNFTLQVTPEITGMFLEDFLKQALQNSQLFEELDKDQVQGLILSSMLTCPNDAKGDNFIVTNPNAEGKRHIIGIDNDLALAADIMKEQEKFHTPEVRHLLFCIPKFMNQKITRKLQDRLLSLSAPHFIMTWLKSLEHHNQQYKKLETDLDVKALNLLKVPLKLKIGTGLSLIKRIETLQRCLKSCTLFTPTLQNLFEELSPLNALYIKRLLEKEKDALRTFDLLYRKEVPFEKLFHPEEDFNGHTLSEHLAHAGQIKDEYKVRSHYLEDIAEETLRNIKVDSMPLESAHALLEDVVTSFPQALNAAFPYLSSKLYNIFAFNPSPALIEAMIESPSHQLTSQQMFTMTCRVLQSSFPQKAFLLEKLLSLSGFDYAQKDEQGNTLLHLWAQYPHLPVPKALWGHWEENGGDFEALNSAGESILDKALKAEHLDLLEGFLTLNKDKGIFYQDQILEEFYQKIKTRAFWKSSLPSPLHMLFRLRREQDPHWRWALKRSKLFSSQGEPIEILTYNQGRISHDKRFLAPYIKDQLWDKQGNFIPYHSNGHRMVGRVIFDCSKDPNTLQKKAIYFKRFPRFAGISMAISLLQEMLFKQGFLPLTFAKIKGEPFLISPGIGTLEKDDKGIFCEMSNFERLLTSNEDSTNKINKLNNLDEEALAQVIIMAMLINPEDGKPSNYALETIKSTGKERIMGFDEEQAFVPAVAKLPETFLEKLNSVVVQMKSILFCMDGMNKPIPQRVKDAILNWDEFKLVKDWVRSLHVLDQKMQALFEGSIPSLFKTHESYVGIPFQKGEITKLLTKIHTLKIYIEKHSPKEKPQPMTLFDVFWHLEPFAAFRYAPILKELKTHSLRDRFLIIDGGIYEQNKGMFERTFSQKEQFPSSLRSGHLLNARQIPVHEDRKDVLKKKGKGFEPQLDLEELEEQEALMAQEGLKGFHSPSFNQASTIASLQQAKLCPIISLESFQAVPPSYQRMVISLLKDQSPQKLELYFSQELTSESLKGMTLNNLMYLNLKGCKNIDDKALIFLNALPDLHTLNLSHIKGLRSFSIGNKPYQGSSLVLLHLGNCERLHSIHCEGPKLKVIKASHNPKFITIELNTPLLENLDLRSNKNLKLETVMKLAKTWASLQDLNIEGCEKIPLKSIKIPLDERSVNELLNHLKKEKDQYAQHNIGLMYRHGQGVKVDYKEGLKWHRKAASQGNAEAYCAIGYMYHMGQGVRQDFTEALKYLHIAVDKGNPVALANIGHMYHYGQGVPQDLEKAREHYEKAVNKGEDETYYKLGAMYALGEGVPQDYSTALSYYKKAMAKGDWYSSEIQYQVAYFYDRGLGTQRNDVKAQGHYKKTYEIALKQAEEGNTGAYGTLGVLYLRGKGVQKDFKKAFDSFEKALEGNQPPAQAWFGKCYKEGCGTKPNAKLAHLWIEKSANNNYPLGPYNLALLYRDGEGVEQDDKRAIELFEKAANYFWPDAFYSLGWMYEHARGVALDLEKANTYYDAGMQRHAEDALYSIGRIYEYGLGGEPIPLANENTLLIKAIG